MRRSRLYYLRALRVNQAREMLLDKYGGVDEEGNYHSPIESKNARFFTMLGALVPILGSNCAAG